MKKNISNLLLDVRIVLIVIDESDSNVKFLLFEQKKKSIYCFFSPKVLFEVKILHKC